MLFKYPEMSPMRSTYIDGIKLAALGLLLFSGIQSCFGAPPSRWISRGVGGGGAFFGPSINPQDPNEFYVASDMSDLFHSRNAGASWEMLNFRSIMGHQRMTSLQFTKDPTALYTLSADEVMKSNDGGKNWTRISPIYDSFYGVFADFANTNRLLCADSTKVYFSTNSGRTFAAVYTNSGMHVAGVFFNGSAIFVGTRYGLLMSTNDGRTFALSAATGIPSTEGMISFAGARQNGSNRFLCVTWNRSSIYPGIMGYELGSYRGVYRLDYGSASWVRATNGLGNNWVAFIGMASNNSAVAYAAGTTIGADYPAVFKTVNGGTTWTQVFQITNNRNVHTGWRGHTTDPNAWQQWWWGTHPMGFTVCASDPNRAIVTDLGFVHLTTNGGISWDQAYVNPTDQNITNVSAKAGKDYHTTGLENTACWSVDWSSPSNLVASFTDIHGTHSDDGGITWTFGTGLVQNTMYEAVKHPTNGRIYAAVSSVHNIYATDEYTEDSLLDGGTGTVVVSQDNGDTWVPLPRLRYPIISLAIDPNNLNRMYVSAVNSSGGGVYVSQNFQSGSAATWTRLASPPRTQGHPYKIHVLKDGTLVCSYSGRLSGGDFTDSSGVFVSTDGGNTWSDRTDTGMRYFTKDVVIDPADANQNTWYAGVWRMDYSSLGQPGLYRTTNRGISWTRIITNLECVGSATVNPARSNEMYVTTKNEGLWFTANARAASPSFTAVTNYPFKHPTRVFFNPYDHNELWIASYGAGLMMGRAAEPEPWIDGMPDPSGVYTQIVVAAEAGQRVVIMASSDLLQWTSLATNTVLDSTVAFVDPFATSNARRFYMARIEP